MADNTLTTKYKVSMSDGQVHQAYKQLYMEFDAAIRAQDMSGIAQTFQAVQAFESNIAEPIGYRRRVDYARQLVAESGDRTRAESLGRYSVNGFRRAALENGININELLSTGTPDGWRGKGIDEAIIQRGFDKNDPYHMAIQDIAREQGYNKDEVANAYSAFQSMESVVQGLKGFDSPDEKVAITKQLYRIQMANNQSVDPNNMARTLNGLQDYFGANAQVAADRTELTGDRQSPAETASRQAINTLMIAMSGAPAAESTLRELLATPGLRTGMGAAELANAAIGLVPAVKELELSVRVAAAGDPSLKADLLKDGKAIRLYEAGLVADNPVAAAEYNKAKKRFDSAMSNIMEADAALAAGDTARATRSMFKAEADKAKVPLADAAGVAIERAVEAGRISAEDADVARTSLITASEAPTPEETEARGWSSRPLRGTEYQNAKDALAEMQAAGKLSAREAADPKRLEIAQDLDAYYTTAAAAAGSEVPEPVSFDGAIAYGLGVKPIVNKGSTKLYGEDDKRAIARSKRRYLAMFESFKPWHFRARYDENVGLAAKKVFGKVFDTDTLYNSSTKIAGFDIQHSDIFDSATEAEQGALSQGLEPYITRALERRVLKWDGKTFSKGDVDAATFKDVELKRGDDTALRTYNIEGKDVTFDLQNQDDVGILRAYVYRDSGETFADVAERVGSGLVRAHDRDAAESKLRRFNIYGVSVDASDKPSVSEVTAVRSLADMKRVLGAASDSYAVTTSSIDRIVNTRLKRAEKAEERQFELAKMGYKAQLDAMQEAAKRGDKEAEEVHRFLSSAVLQAARQTDITPEESFASAVRLLESNPALKARYDRVVQRLSTPAE